MCKYCNNIEKKNFSNPKEGQLRVWHMPQLGMGKGFLYPVSTPKEGKTLIDMLAQYDLFQFEHKVKGDYSNASTLQVYESDGEGGLDWCDWYNENGENIDEVEFE